MASVLEGALPEKESQTASLLTIPLELRQQIYELVFPLATIEIQDKAYLMLPPKLAAVCKQMRNETRRLERGQHSDYYHRRELRDELSSAFWNLQHGYPRVMEDWRVIVETPSHAKYNMVMLQGIFKYTLHQPCCMWLHVSGLRYREDEPRNVVTYIGGMTSPMLRRHMHPKYSKSQEDTGISRARLLAEILVRLEGQVHDPRGVADIKRKTLRHLLRLLLGKKFERERFLLEEMKAEMADAKAGADIMQLLEGQL